MVLFITIPLNNPVRKTHFAKSLPGLSSYIYVTTTANPNYKENMFHSREKVEWKHFFTFQFLDNKYIWKILWLFLSHQPSNSIK